jgi:hypothetical protein
MTAHVDGQQGWITSLLPDSQHTHASRGWGSCAAADHTLLPGTQP